MVQARSYADYTLYGRQPDRRRPVGLFFQGVRGGELPACGARTMAAELGWVGPELGRGQVA